MTPRSGPGGPNSGPRGPKTTPRAPQERAGAPQGRQKKNINNELRLSAGPGALREPFWKTISEPPGKHVQRFWNAFWLPFSTPRRFIFEGLRQRPSS